MVLSPTLPELLFWSVVAGALTALWIDGFLSWLVHFFLYRADYWIGRFRVYLRKRLRHD